MLINFDIYFMKNIDVSSYNRVCFIGYANLKLLITKAIQFVSFYRELTENNEINQNS